MKPFEIIEHTADIGIRAFGATAAEAFQNAAAGMFSLITDLDSIRETESFDVEVESEDIETLLVEWLNELLFLFESREAVLSRFEINEFTENSLKATVLGEALDPVRHALKTDIKAVTYHMLSVAEKDGRWVAQTIFDI